MRPTPIVAIAAALLTLVGCSPAAPASPPTDAPSASTTPTPSTSADTPQQFASIIAGEESDWREVIEAAGECRILWTVGGGDASDDAKALTCYLRETTAVMSTGTAAKELRELTPPAEIESLVTDTLEALDAVSGIDLEGVCGDAFDGPKDSSKCNATLGEAYSAYLDLDDALDRWKPYM